LSGPGGPKSGVGRGIDQALFSGFSRPYDVVLHSAACSQTEAVRPPLAALTCAGRPLDRDRTHAKTRRWRRLTPASPRHLTNPARWQGPTGETGPVQNEW